MTPLDSRISNSPPPHTHTKILSPETLLKLDFRRIFLPKALKS